jgi:hypothetical protein
MRKQRLRADRLRSLSAHVVAVRELQRNGRAMFRIDVPLSICRPLGAVLAATLRRSGRHAPRTSNLSNCNAALNGIIGQVAVHFLLQKALPSVAMTLPGLGPDHGFDHELKLVERVFRIETKTSRFGDGRDGSTLMHSDKLRVNSAVLRADAYVWAILRPIRSNVSAQVDVPVFLPREFVNQFKKRGGGFEVPFGHIDPKLSPSILFDNGTPSTIARSWTYAVSPPPSYLPFTAQLEFALAALNQPVAIWTARELLRDERFAAQVTANVDEMNKLVDEECRKCRGRDRSLRQSADISLSLERIEESHIESI